MRGLGTDTKSRLWKLDGTMFVFGSVSEDKLSLRTRHWLAPVFMGFASIICWYACFLGDAKPPWLWALGFVLSFLSFLHYAWEEHTLVVDLKADGIQCLHRTAWGTSSTKHVGLGHICRIEKVTIVQPEDNDYECHVRFADGGSMNIGESFKLATILARFLRDQGYELELVRITRSSGFFRRSTKEQKERL